MAPTSKRPVHELAPHCPFLQLIRGPKFTALSPGRSNGGNSSIIQPTAPPCLPAPAHPLGSREISSSSSSASHNMALTIDLEAGLRPPPPEQGTPDGRLLFRRQLGQGAEGKVFVAVPTRRPQQHQQQSLLGPTSPTSSSSASDDVAQSYPRQQPPRRQVAVKVMSGQAYERCRATRSLWPGLVHPNIVFPRKGCFDDTNGRCFVEMELCETDLLDMVVRGGALRDSRASVFAGQLASALQHLHGQGIAHRDVKLENVFVRDGAAKLGDLGSIAQVPPPTKVPASCQQQHHDEHNHNHIDDDSIRNNNTSINKAAAIVPSSSASSSSKATCSFVGSAMYAPPEAVRRGRGNSNSGAAVSIAGACQGRSSSSSSSGAASRPPSYSRHDPFAGDVWALGVTLWSAKARSHPWEMACVDRSKEFRRFVRKGAEAVFPDNFSPGGRVFYGKRARGGSYVAMYVCCARFLLGTR